MDVKYTSEFIVPGQVAYRHYQTAFDLVVSFQVIEHIDPNMVFAIKEIKRVGKDRGMLGISTPSGSGALDKPVTFVF